MRQIELEHGYLSPDLIYLDYKVNISASNKR